MGVLVYDLKTSSSTWKECKTFDQQVNFNLNIKKGWFFCFVCVFVFPNGKPYIIMMKIYLISVSVSDVSFSQAG